MGPRQLCSIKKQGARELEAKNCGGTLKTGLVERGFVFFCFLFGPQSFFTTLGEKAESSLQAPSSVLSWKEGPSNVPDRPRFSWMSHKVFPPSPHASEDVFLSQNR